MLCERKGVHYIMLTQDVVNAIAEITGGTKKDAKAHLDAFKEVVVSALARKEAVELKGFVSFETKDVEARTAKNPQNGKDVPVPAHTKASASLAKSLRKF